MGRDQKDDVILDKPGAFWVVRTSQAEGPARPGATPEQLQKFISQAEFKPGSGVLLEGETLASLVSLPRCGLQACPGLAHAPGRRRLSSRHSQKGSRYEVRINVSPPNSTHRPCSNASRPMQAWP
ncbi:MAG: hypothetical protein R3E56_08945 [Burkholderiaceae bacterium]